MRFRRLHPDEDKSLATCNIVVMEFCDRGSLRQALKRGVFHKRLGSTSVAVDLCAIVQVLIEVAQAVLHLHKMKLLHCDIKPENVLLRSDTTSALGFVTKLSDFGLAKLLREVREGGVGGGVCVFFCWGRESERGFLRGSVCRVPLLRVLDS